MPEPWLIVLLAMLGLILVVAAWSDRRDRRAGFDPRDRVAALKQRKIDRRKRRRDWISSKIGADRPEDNPRSGSGRL